MLIIFIGSIQIVNVVGLSSELQCLSGVQHSSLLVSAELAGSKDLSTTKKQLGFLTSYKTCNFSLFQNFF